jgi:hypothetical protein
MLWKSAQKMLNTQTFPAKNPTRQQLLLLALFPQTSHSTYPTRGMVLELLDMKSCAF